MFPEFAYSRAMQLILAGISFVTAYIFVYCIANLILRLYGEKATFRRKSLFAFWIGVVFDSAWVYLVYFIGGMQSFSDTAYLFIVTSNPIFALLCYYIGIKVLKLSPVRSIRLMGYTYMYFITTKSLSRLIGSVFFAQLPGRYNYMLDALSRITFFFVFLVILWVTQYVLRRNNQVIELRDSLFINLKKEIAVYFAKATGIYLFTVMTPLLVTHKNAALAFVLIILAMSTALALMTDLYKAAKNNASNALAHVGILSNEISITYMGDAVDLRKKINVNPSLVSILLNKVDYAEKMKVNIRIVLQSRLDSFPISNVDVCLIVACLLDNAIEAAAASEQKTVSFAIETKDTAETLMIISNSTAAPVDTDKIISGGIRRAESGIASVRRIASKYGNCTFHLSYYDYMVTAYFAIRGR